MAEHGEETQPDEEAEPVLWLPSGLTVDEVELVTRLDQERATRSLG